MDASEKANFINSVKQNFGESDIAEKPNAMTPANLDQITTKPVFCAFCGSALKQESVFCKFCGAAVKKKNVDTSQTPGTIKTQVDNLVQPQVDKVAIPQAEELSAFAKGLPEWDIVPPQVMVRVRRTI
jgi:hypothetical protein